MRRACVAWPDMRPTLHSSTTPGHTRARRPRLLEPTWHYSINASRTKQCGCMRRQTVPVGPRAEKSPLARRPRQPVPRATKCCASLLSPMPSVVVMAEPSLKAYT
ncbi:hypothetical protein BD309DRAFT_279740 [Dichomitus squalens]|nr:hypothetical protein BD309DRAFT_279740 [Dichomitus squalens]